MNAPNTVEAVIRERLSTAMGGWRGSCEAALPTVAFVIVWTATKNLNAALLAAGHAGAEYDAWLINIGEGDQFGSGFVGVNPNSKIPALLVLEVAPGSVAERAGVLPGDVLLAADAVTLHSADDLTAVLRRAAPSGTVTLDLGRAGRRTTVPVVLADARRPSARAA